MRTRRNRKGGEGFFDKYNPFKPKPTTSPTNATLPTDATSKDAKTQLVNELTPEEIDEINKLQQEELTSWSKDKESVINADMEKIRKLDGKIRKYIIAGIGNYNVAQRTLDKINVNLTREEKSKYPCGSITCKQRGRKIKNALVELSNIDEHALGEIGLSGVMESLGNYWTGNKNNATRPETQPPVASEPAMGGTRRRSTRRRGNRRR